MGKLDFKTRILFRQKPVRNKLEDKVFGIVSFWASVICFISIIVNIIVVNHLVMNLIFTLLGITFITFGYLSYFRGVTKPLVLPFQLLVAFVLTTGWFYYQGIEGTVPLYFLPVLFLLIYTNPIKNNYKLLIGFVILAIILVLLHYWFPEKVISYPTDKSRILNISVSFIITLGVIGFEALILKRNFEAEQRKAELRNKELEISEARLKRAELASGTGNWELHLESQKIITSEGAMKVYGLDDQQYDFKVIKEIPLPEYRKQLDDALENLLKNREPYDIEFKIKTLDTCEIKDIHSIAVFDKEKKIVFGIIQDITRQKQVEKALQESEVRMRTLIQTIPDLIWVKNENGVYLSCNPMFERFFGAKEAEIAGKTDYDFVGQELADSFREHDRAAMAFGKPSENEEWVTFADDGHRALLDTIKTPMHDTEGKLIGVLGIARDITERNQAELALRESEEKFRTLFTEMSEGFAFHEIIYDKTHKAIDYKIIDVNPAFEKQVGISMEKAKGMLATQLYDVSTAPYLDIYAHVAATGEHQFLQLHFPPLDRYFDISAFSPIPGYFATVFNDVTERILAEKAIKDSQSKLSNAITIAHLGPWEYDVEKDIFTFNDSFYSLFRTNVKEVGGYTMSALDYATRFVHPDDFQMVGQETQKAIEANDSNFFREIEHRMIYADGETGYIKVRFTLIKDNYGKTIKTYGINQDITEQIRNERILKENATSLRELNAAKDKFFSIIAHDLKSPFNSILGLSNMLAEQIQGKNTEGIEEYAGIIQKSSHNAMELLSNLLEWARSQTGKMDFTPEPFEIISLINSVIALLEESARQKSISIVKELPQSIYVHADKAMISTILRNLISNAIKFTRLNGEITISINQQPENLQLTVCDNGIGIKKEAIPKLFRIDENVSTYGTQNETGTGLGLILCKEFIEKHGGKIWVESTPGVGSKFHFTIPIA